MHWYTICSCNGMKVTEMCWTWPIIVEDIVTGGQQKGWRIGRGKFLLNLGPIIPRSDAKYRIQGMEGTRNLSWLPHALTGNILCKLWTHVFQSKHGNKAKYTFTNCALKWKFSATSLKIYLAWYFRFPDLTGKLCGYCWMKYSNTQFETLTLSFSPMWILLMC